MAAILLTLLLLSPLLAPHHTQSRPDPVDPAAAEAEPVDDECSGRRIYIRPLPSRFNTDLLSSCDSFPIRDHPASFCPFVANHGLGPKTHRRSRSWYRTDPLLLEPLFHRRVGEHPCLTADPLAADAVFLPYYAALDALPFLYSPQFWNSSALHGLRLHRLLTSGDDGGALWRRRGGHDHFLVMSRPAWDFSQDPDADPPVWGTSFLSRPEFFNLTALVLESRPSPWQEQAIPHPTSFHPANLSHLESWLARARRSRRDKLMLFAGGGVSGGVNIRASIHTECANRTDLCATVDCSGGACVHDPAFYTRPMLRADFCLQPPGDTPTRRSTFDAMIAGCIPVFFEEAAARAQYAWHLDPGRFEEFSVLIPKEDVVFGGVRIADVLVGISPARVRRMRERVLEMAPRVMYRRYGSSKELRTRKDAVDLALEGVLRRIRGRVRSLADPHADPDEEIYGRDPL